MQIRELDLKELEQAYTVVCQLRDELSYQEFEDLIYEMRHMEYKMLGIFERGELVTYAGVSVNTTLKHKRHLCVYDFVTDKKKSIKTYQEMMRTYIRDYAKTCMCEKILFLDELQIEEL
ncbi:MAG: GNAT family N-acetyltransferase [Sulfurimonas sp.]|nr:GNAT family N-acetyltransferase [Sulfurimonas sp.]